MAKQLTVIEWSRDKWRVLQGAVNGAAPRISRYWEKDIVGLSASDMTMHLRQFLRDRRYPPGEIVIVIPRGEIYLRRSMLEVSEDRRTGVYSPREVICAVDNDLQSEKGEKTRLCFLAERKLIENMVGIVEKAGFLPKAVIPGACGLLGWFSAQRIISSDDDTRALFNVDGIESELLVIHQGRIIFSRALPYKPEDFVAGKLHEVMNDWEMSLQKWQDEDPGLDIREVYVAGLSALPLELFEKSLQERYEIAVKSLPPFVPPQNPEVNANILWGVFQAINNIGVNLLPGSNVDAYRRRIILKELLHFLFVVVMALALGRVNAEVFLNRDQRYLNELQQVLTVNKKGVQTAQMQLELAQMAAREQRNYSPLSDALQQILGTIPAKVFVADIDKQDKTLTIQGSGEHQEDVVSWQNKLISSVILKDVRLEYLRAQQRNNISYFEFKLVATLPEGVR